MIDSRLLRAFKAVAEELHFGRAAQRLHMSQPPLSLSIRQLEAALGAPLFVRTTRQVQLTAAGTALLQRLPRIEAAHQEALEAVRHMALGISGELSVALTPSAAFTPIPLVLRSFRAQFPDVHLQFREMNSRDMGQALRTGAVDLAIGRLFTRSDALKAHALYREPMYLSLPKGHRLADRHSVTLQEALATEVIGYCPKESLYFHRLLAQLEQKAGVQRTHKLLSIVPTILLLVEGGMGTAIVAHSLTRLRNDTLVHLPIAGVDDVHAELAAIHRSADTSPILDRLLQQLRAQLDAHV